MSPPERQVTVVFRGEPGAPLNPRLEPMATALSAEGLLVRSVSFHHDHASALQDRLDGLGPGDAVLVWADPLGDDGDRTSLDLVLRHAEASGAWVSARPDVVDRLGTKEVLVTSRDLGWGSDAHCYRDIEEFRRELPARLAADGVRVLKADRGNGGRTVWKVRLPGGPGATTPGPDAQVVVQHARARDGTAMPMTITDLGRLIEDAGVFTGWGGTGRLVDQEFVPGVTSGIVRCYLVGSVVVGFARQYPAGVRPDGPLAVIPESVPPPNDVMGLPSPKTMYSPDEPAFGALRQQLEADWVPRLTELVDLEPDDLPALWDVDLLIAEPTLGVVADLGRDGPTPGTRFVLCEINASSVIPFPPQAPPLVARHVVDALSRA